jgi:hypothetical protein
LAPIKRIGNLREMSVMKEPKPPAPVKFGEPHNSFTKFPKGKDLKDIKPALMKAAVYKCQ